MENFLNWIQAHLPELAAALGLGGAGVVGGKKLIDKTQDAEIKKIKAELSEVKKMSYDNQNSIQLMNKDLAENKRLDEMLRAEMKEERREWKEGVATLNTKIDKVVDYLLNQKK